MFAYCPNNPVLLIDYNGAASMVCFSDDTIFPDKPWRNGGVRISYNGDWGKYTILTEEQIVLQATGITSYKGVPVIEVPFMGNEAFSLPVRM